MSAAVILVAISLGIQLTVFGAAVGLDEPKMGVPALFTAAVLIAALVAL